MAMHPTDNVALIPSKVRRSKIVDIIEDCRWRRTLQILLH
jgi:hypothetical protein